MDVRFSRLSLDRDISNLSHPKLTPGLVLLAATYGKVNIA
jgi:hypothetical protein